MNQLTADQLTRILERYVRTYSAADGVWCIADHPHLARSVHVREDGFVACWQHHRQAANS